MEKRIKVIKRVKKKSLYKKFNFDDDTDNYSIKSSLRKLTVLIVLIGAFFVTLTGVIKPTNNKAQLIRPDLILKNSAIENGKKIQENLISEEKIANSELNNLKISFFQIDKGEPFYKFLSNKALKNGLIISSIKKISEANYQEPKKDTLEEFVIYENYQQIAYETKFQGTFIDYINFIKDIQYADRSLSTSDVIIEKIDDNKVDVSATLTVNIMKI